MSTPLPVGVLYFSRFIIYTFFLFLLIYSVLGVGFWGFGLSVDGVWGLWCGAFYGFFGVGVLYINIEE